MDSRMKESIKSNNQGSLAGDKLDIDQVELKPQWKIYLGVIWGIFCVVLFSFNPLLGIIAPILYVLYLFLDTKLDGCCKRLIQRFKRKMLKKINAAQSHLF